MAIKLYPPQLEGTLPAFYKTYTDNTKTELEGANIEIPFGMNRAVSQTSIKKVSCRLRTIATNTYLAIKETEVIDFTKGVVNINLNAEEASQFNEGQYYKVQLAFVDSSNTVGYYSTVGVIKCVAKPLQVTIANFTTATTNQFTNEFIGVYEQDTRFGDSTEKVYSYSFTLTDKEGNIIDEVIDQIHDSTQDTSSFSSRDIFKTYKVIKDGTMGYIQYTVKTMNGLVISSNKFQVIKAKSVPLENPITLIATTNFENGYIDLNLQGTVTADSQGSHHELVYSGTYIITRTIVYGEDNKESDENFEEWEEITRFIIEAGYPSEYSFRDYTVQQGIRYRYALQQYNINGVYSTPEKSQNRRLDDPYNLYDEPTKADFEDMYLYDGHRQLKIRFNPKVDSFKNSIPEQKIETIGSKYPFIFRNGNVCYKEFPIAGLISFQMDESTLFLDDEEIFQAGILEDDKFRKITQPYSDQSHKSWGHEQSYGFSTITRTIRDPYTGAETQEEITTYDPRVKAENPILDLKYDTASYNNIYGKKFEEDYEGKKPERIVRMNKDLTTQNIMSERYFKLKVLDWLTNGKVKLFRSPGEGNYLVRLLNVSMKPQDPLGRMIHEFTCTGYEIAQLTYDNLVYYGIVDNHAPTIMEKHWSSIDLKPLIINRTPGEWIELPTGNASIENFSLTGFVPGDQVRIHFADDVEDRAFTFTIGATGTFNYAYDDRIISKIEILPVEEPDYYDDFDRNIVYQYPGLLLTKFDTISSISTHTQVAEEFVGPKENLLTPYNLLSLVSMHDSVAYNILRQNIEDKNNINYSLNKDGKFTLIGLDLLKVRKRIVIPVYACENLTNNGNNNFSPNETTKYSMTPFGIGYVNNMMITNYNNNVFTRIDVVDHNDLENEDGTYKDIWTVVPIGATSPKEKQINDYDIWDIVKENNEFYQYTGDPNRLVDCFTILKVYIPYKEEDTWGWKASNISGYKYYDTYYNKWWEGDLEYDPTFSINSNEATKNRFVEKANKYISVNGQYGWHPDWEENEEATKKRQVQVPIYKQDQLTTAYNNYTKEEDCFQLVNSLYSYDENYDQNKSYYIKDQEGIYNKFKFTSTTNINIIKEAWNTACHNGSLYEFISDKTNDISVDDIEEITLYKLGNVELIRLGSGVMAEITAQIQVIDYLIEETDSVVAQNKRDYKGKDSSGNDVGIYAEFQKALTNFMTKKQQVQNAIDETNELRQQIEEYQNKKQNYINAINSISGFETTIKEVMEALRYKLYHYIQGAWTLPDKYSSPEVNKVKINITKLLSKIFIIVNSTMTYDNNKIYYIKDSNNFLSLYTDYSEESWNTAIGQEKLYILNNESTWIEIPLDDYELQSASVKLYNTDQVKFIYRNIQNNEITEEVIQLNSNSTITKTYNEKSITNIYINLGVISDNDHYREVQGTYYNKRLGNIGNFLIENSYPTISGSKRYWQPLNSPISIDGDGYNYKIKINNSDYYAYFSGSNAPVERPVIAVTPVDSVENATKFLQQRNYTYNNVNINSQEEILAYRNNSILGLVNDTTFNNVLNIYEILLRQSLGSANRITNFINLLLNTEELIDTNGLRTNRKYYEWLIKQLLDKPDGIIWKIYNQLHYFSTLEEQLDTEYPMTQNEYSNYLFISTNEEDYEDFIFTPDTTNYDTIRENIYIDSNSTNIESKHFQGELVDKYDDLLAIENQYKKIIKELQTHIQYMENNSFYTSEDIEYWSNIETYLADAERDLNTYETYLENTDLIQNAEIDDPILSGGQYSDIESYLRMKIVQLSLQINNYLDILNNENYLIYQKDSNLKNSYERELNTLYRELMSKASEYNSQLESYKHLVFFFGSYSTPITLEELLDEYQNLVIANKQTSTNEIDILQINNTIVNYNKTYNKYLDHINQLKYNQNNIDQGTPVSTVEKIVYKILQFLESYENASNLQSSYNNKINEIEEDIAKATDRIIQLEKDANIDIPEEFDNDDWMSQIKDKLTIYLLSLAQSYQVNVEERYNV